MWGLTMKFASLILMLLFATVARAEDYYWKIQSLPERFSSPSAACAAWAKATGRPGVFTFTGSMKARDQTSFWCEFTNNETGKTAAGYGPAARYGDSCPADTEYNKETGECKENKCKILAGSLYEKSHQAPISRFINYLGCEIAVSAIDGCIGPAEGQAGATYCKVIGSFTGNWFTSNGSCAFGCDVGPGDGPPPGGDGGTGGDGGSNPPGGDGGSDGGTKPGGGDNGSSGGGGG
ncbi:attachment protein, partial [Pseudomonas aeruginosa]